MAKAFKHEDIEQILAEAEDFLQQIDHELMEYMDAEQRAQLEEQAQTLKQLKSEVHDKIEKEGTSESTSYSEGVHQAMEDVVKAMKSLATYLS
jgi:DNA-binding transcriptional MerR regulator